MYLILVVYYKIKKEKEIDKFILKFKFYSKYLCVKVM